jgi:hypothetical protein
VTGVKVWTKDGPVDRSELVATDVVTENETARVVATEWHRAGELVRRDVHVNILMGHLVGAEQGGAA